MIEVCDDIHILLFGSRLSEVSQSIHHVITSGNEPVGRPFPVIGTLRTTLKLGLLANFSWHLQGSKFGNGVSMFGAANEGCNGGRSYFLGYQMKDKILLDYFHL